MSSPIYTRITGPVLRSLKAAARKRKVTLSQEIRDRLEDSINREKAARRRKKRS